MKHTPSEFTTIPPRHPVVFTCISTLLLVLLTVIPLRSRAEWTSEGVIFNNSDFVNYFDAVPCSAGGMWFVWEEDYGWYTTEIYAQRITEEGDLVFAEPLTPHDDALDGDLLAGALPGDDGSLLVVYLRADVDGVKRLFVQRFALDGTRLHDGFGQYASNPDTPYSIYFWAIGARTDGNGGCWTLFDREYGGVFLNGWNSDGSLKFDESLDISADTMDNLNLLTPDGHGGVIHVEVREPEDPYPDLHDIYVQRYNYDGTTQFPEPLLVNEDGGDYYDRHYLVMDTQNDGVFLLTDNHWQYYDSSFNPQWPENLEPYFGNPGVSVLSSPVVFEDNTVVQAQSGHPTSNGMILVHSDGTIDESTINPVSLFQHDAARDLELNSVNHLVTKVCLDTDDDHEQFYIAIFDSLGNEIHDRVPVLPEPREWFAPHFYELYRFSDTSLMTGQNYNGYFRLWCVDELTGAIYGRPNAVSEAVAPQLPAWFSIASIYPNPFNSSCTIQIDVKRRTALSFSVYDILGALVHEQSLGETAVGMHTVDWVPTPEHASGLYFIRLRDGTAGVTQTRKVVLIK